MDSSSESDRDEMSILIRSTALDAECGFCAQAVPEGSGIVIAQCRHTLCNHCAREMIDAANTEEVNCLVYEDGQRCPGILTMAEIKEFIFEEYYQEAFDQYKERVKNSALAKELKANPNRHLCLNEDCNKKFDLAEDAEDFVCNGCGFHTCIKCKCLTNRPPGSKCERKCNLFSYQSPPESTWNLRKRKHAPNNYAVRPNSVVKRAVVDIKNLFNEEVQKDWMSGWEQIMEKLRSANTIAEMDSTEEIIKYIDAFDCIENPKEFECSICMVEIPPGDGVILKDCYHTFCKMCISSLVEHCDEPNVRCPFQSSGYTCNCFINDREIRACVTPEIIEKHIQRSLQAAELTNKNAFHCKTLDCNFWCEVEVINGCFTCPNCQKKNCIKCKAAHENVSCQVYWQSVTKEDCDPESRKALTEMIEKGEAMRCPNCRVVVTKSEGCDSVFCRICRLQICWATKGPRWGPKGHGDISGGCRCKVNGKLCHPKCRNCH